eukprot:154386_1
MSINPVNFGPVADSQSMKLELAADSEPVDADGLTDSDKSNVYVQGLPPHVDEDLLYAMFCGYGIVRKWTIKRQPSGESRSYGFVQFDNQNSAENAIASLTGVSINGRKLVVRIAIPKHIQTIQINLYVKNLPPTMTTERLRDLFKPFGTVTSHTIMKDENGVCTGVGFVRFLKEEQGRAAVSDLNGQRPGTDFTTEGICVEEAKEPARAQQQPQQRYGPVHASGGANRQVRAAAEPYSGDTDGGGKEDKKSSGPQDPCNVYIHNFPKMWSKTDLLRLFEQFGPITSAKVLQDKQTGESRQIGFVRMGDADSAARAIHGIDTKVIEGVVVTAKLATFGPRGGKGMPNQTTVSTTYGQSTFGQPSYGPPSSGKSAYDPPRGNDRGPPPSGNNQSQYGGRYEYGGQSYGQPGPQYGPGSYGSYGQYGASGYQ